MRYHLEHTINSGTYKVVDSTGKVLTTCKRVEDAKLIINALNAYTAGTQ